jgi:hypothetical protein
MATDFAELIARWDSGDGKPYKGSLIDWEAFEADQSNIGCMCAQGQALHLLGGWSPAKLRDTDQEKADKATAKLLNISIAHSILLRSINDKADGAPSVVLTNPEKILGDQAQIVLAFWLHLDGMKAKDWKKVAAAWAAAWEAARAAARAAAWAAAWAAARAAAWAAAWEAARAAARAAAWAAARAAAWAAAWDAAWDAAYACSEIQGARLMRERGKPFFFLPMFGFADPESIPALPADYGRVA